MAPVTGVLCGTVWPQAARGSSRLALGERDALLCGEGVGAGGGWEGRTTGAGRVIIEEGLEEEEEEEEVEVEVEVEEEKEEEREEKEMGNNCSCFA